MANVTAALFDSWASAWCAGAGGPTALAVAWADAAGGVEVRAAGGPQAEDGAPVSAQTWFRIGSVSKTLTALAVLNWAEQAGHDIGAPVSFAFAGAGQAPAGGGVTLRSLLSHTAGLGNAVALATPAPGGAAEWLAAAAPCGFRFSYSNTGYALLGMWMDAVTGLPPAEWLARFALTPLGIGGGIGFAPPAGAATVRGHVFDPLGQRREVLTLDFGDRRFAPAGFLWATAHGLGALTRGLLHPPSPRLAAIVARMAAPQSEAIGPGGVSYGLGLFCGESGGRRIVFHEGEIGGFRALVDLDPERRTGRAMVMNMSGPGPSLRTMLQDGPAAVAGETDGGAPFRPALCRHRGAVSFAVPSLGIVQVHRASDGLTGFRNGRPFPLRSAAPGLYGGRCGGHPVMIVSKTALDGAAYVYVNGQMARAVRLRDRSGSRLDPIWFGRYVNGYWIDVRATGDGGVRVATNYTGTAGPALVLSRRSLAVDAGIMVFRLRDGRPSLWLMGVNWFQTP